MSFVTHEADDYARKYEHIIPTTDTAFAVKHYVLSDDEKHRVIKEYKPKEEGWYRFAKYIGTPRLYIPYYVWGKDGNKQPILNQRLLLIYRKDTMTIDFIDIPSFNPNGFTDVMEKLEFYPHAYIRLYRGIYERHPELREYESRQALLSLDSLLRKGFYDTTYDLLRKAGMMEDRSDYKRVVVLKNGARDTSEQKDYPVYSVKPEDMRLTYPARQPDVQEIRLRTVEPPLITDSGLQYRFVFSFPFPTGREAWMTPLSKEEERALSLLKAFTKGSLYINGNPFSGRVLMYYHSSWDTVSARGGTYDLIVSIYRDGKMVSTATIYDVGFLNSEQERVRPV